MTSAPVTLDSLNIAGDGDDIDMVQAIEATFELDFGDSTIEWRTVGDIERSVLAAFAPSETPGKCATSMAFYRLRTGIAALRPGHETIRPDTRLKVLGLGPAGPALRGLSDRVGLRLAKPPMGWVGVMGLLLMLAGIVAVVPMGWRGLALIPAGIALCAVDRGDFGRMTVGDLARQAAKDNMAALARLGADRRPEAIWTTLRDTIAEMSGYDAPAISRTTRLAA